MTTPLAVSPTIAFTGSPESSQSPQLSLTFYNNKSCQLPKHGIARTRCCKSNDKCNSATAVCRTWVISWPFSQTSQPRPHAPSTGASQLSWTKRISLAWVSIPSASRLPRYSSCELPGSGFRITCKQKVLTLYRPALRVKTGTHSYCCIQLEP